MNTVTIKQNYHSNILYDVYHNGVLITTTDRKGAEDYKRMVEEAERKEAEKKDAAK